MTTSYANYHPEQMRRTKQNPLSTLYPPLPAFKYDILYADPPWDYGGKTQYDKSGTRAHNPNFTHKIFLSAANFQYPTLPLKELMELPVATITAEDALLFLWTTGPQLERAMRLGCAWGFTYQTVAFVWNKLRHNPGHYTLSQTEFVLLFKHGRIPQPRGARNVRQYVEAERQKHSEKPQDVLDGITKMFPTQRKIELFARKRNDGWDAWGLDVPS